jgi:proline racemase
MQGRLDHYRRLLMLEPRGHADMYGAVLTPPATADGDVGVLFMHNEGYSTMCGHGIIALVTAALEQGVFTPADSAKVRIDTPAGRVTAQAHAVGPGRVDAVSFRNVPSFVLHEGVAVTVEGKTVDATVAYGGAFYAYVDASEWGLRLNRSEAGKLIRIGREIKRAVTDSCDIHHPAGDEDLGFLYGTVFVLDGPTAHESRNVCIFADGEVDRSPTGTGVSGRAAIHFARGEITLGDTLTIQSVIGTSFQVRCLEETRVGRLPAVIPEVTGQAFLTGRHEFMLDENDPLGDGFLVR